MRTLLLIGSLSLAACEDRVADRTEHAADRVTKRAAQLRQESRALANTDDVAGTVRDVSREAGELAEAQQDYAQLKGLRVDSLLAAHAVAASQPVLIEQIAAAKVLSPALRVRLAENLALFRHRLVETHRAIEELAFVTADEWERRDDTLRRQMAGLYLARDASWELLDDNHRDPPFPGT